MALTKCKECEEEISKKASKCPKCGAPQKKRTSLFTWLITIFIGLIIITSLNVADKTNTTKKEYKPSPKLMAIKNTELEFTWKKASFGNIMEASFTIKNKNNHQIKDVEITCMNYAKSGTIVDSNKRTIFDVIPANSTKKFEKFNMGFIHSQADKTGCAVTSLTF